MKPDFATVLSTPSLGEMIELLQRYYERPVHLKATSKETWDVECKTGRIRNVLVIAFRGRFRLVKLVTGEGDFL